MKKILIGIVLIGIIWVFYSQSKKGDDVVKPIIKPSQPSQPIPTTHNLQPVSFSLFFPYWTLSENEAVASSPPITKYIYFGVAPDTQGINQSEAGFDKIESFANTYPEEKKALVLRMVNDEVSSTILKSTPLAAAVISQTIEIAKRYGFSEVILDLEVKSLPFEGATEEITDFYVYASSQIKNAGLKFSTTLYGDTFYRKRPYDVKKISGLVDHIYIMAYDFHKSYGTPGPNFPLSGKDQYGYDIKQMIADFSSQIEPEKITVVFGFFGYDWTVDEKNRPLKAASALTLNQIKTKFLTSCSFVNCNAKKDELSAETLVSYQDENDRTHQVWFENEASIAQKMKTLQSLGIVSFSFWAKGYY